MRNVLNDVNKVDSLVLEEESSSSDEEYDEKTKVARQNAMKKLSIVTTLSRRQTKQW